MNIIIPSSKIYSKNHNLVKDNAITRIDVEVAVASKTIEDEVSIWDESKTFSSTDSPDMTKENTKKVDYSRTSSGSNNSTSTQAVVVLNHVVKFKKIDLEIDAAQTNETVLSVTKEFNDFYLPTNIAFDVLKTTIEIEGKVNISTSEYSWTKEGSKSTDYVSEIPNFSGVSHSYTYKGVTASIESDAFPLPQKPSSYYSLSEEGVAINKKFKLSLYIPYETTIEKAGSGQDALVTSGISVQGTREVYFVKSASITVRGKKIVLQISKETKSLGDGEKPWKIEGGEFLQSEDRYETTLEEYKNGKETIKLTCSLVDYYDVSGKKVISARGDTSDGLPMTFRLYDRVVPYVMNEQGKEEPISTYSNGRAKEYYVLNVRRFYDGASMQELTLQEALPEESYYSYENEYGGTTYVISSSSVSKVGGRVDISTT